MKVFIGGSISIKELDNTVKDELYKLLKSNCEILVGDAYGVDSLIQKYCLENDYKNVTVYTCNRRPRNNVGDFKVKKITPLLGVSGRDFYTEKDKAMSYYCDLGFMIWDGTSQGTLNNIRRLAKYSIKITVYLSDKQQMKHINNYNDYKKFTEER